MSHFPPRLHHSAMTGSNTLLHHPQPLSFAPLGHHMGPSLLPPVKLEQSKFEFTLGAPNRGDGNGGGPGQMPGANILSPIKMEHTKMTSVGGFEFSAAGHMQHMYKSLEPMPPSPTDSKSSISVDSPSESLTSPHSTVDGSSSVLSPTPINATSLSLPSPLSQNGVLDILMSTDKCQEFIQYQMHNSSIAFPAFTPVSSASSGVTLGSPVTPTSAPPPPPVPPPSSTTTGSAQPHPPPPPPLVPHPIALTALPPEGPTIVRLPTWEILQETTARLLFMSVRWVRCLIPFQTLSKNDQHLLLQVCNGSQLFRRIRNQIYCFLPLSPFPYPKESWKELFLLNFAQWSVPWDLSSLLDSPQVRDRLPPDAATQLEMKTMQEILCRFRQISPDLSELGCMKAVILFSPETSELCDVQPVEMLQDQAQCVLSEHVRVRYPRQPTRFGRLLLLLPLLRTIRSTTIETLFFKETIGTVPISRLLIDMYQMEKYTDLEGGTGTQTPNGTITPKA
uniref:NR LBD domain-containing protein n=1 Tax=Anopheles funestus TaxID=62324 RepID=A0A182RRF8_ANOFN